MRTCYEKDGLCFFAMILFFAFPIVSSASGQTLEEDYSALDEYSDMVDEELDVAVDDETHEQIEALGIEEKDVSQLTLGGVFLQYLISSPSQLQNH